MMIKKVSLLLLLTIVAAKAQDETINEEVEIVDGTAASEVQTDIPEEIPPEEPIEDIAPPELPAPAPDVEVSDHVEDTGPKQRLIDYVDYANWDSLTSRYAPQRESARTTGIPWVITEQRLAQLRAQFMYWFWDRGGPDNEGDFQRAIQSSTQTIHKNFNFQLPFFGFRFNYTRVSLNGYLEFSDPPDNFEAYPLTFPVKDWPRVNDPSFIGIFFSKCRVGAIRAEEIDQRRPGVYYRMERDLQFRTDQFGVEVRERLKWDIRNGIIGADNFEAKHAVIVTWKNVTFAGGISQSIFFTNTFQIILATDEVITYCIFNYLDITWTSHTEAGSDTLKGEGGVPAFVGFNAGNGTRSWEYAPYSQGPTIRDLVGRGWANGFPGRHIFRIDENILTGNCNKDIDGANLPLMFAPESGNMLGGTIVNITGPCFLRTDKVQCKFDVEPEVVGIVVDSNRAICVQPRLSVEGYVRFEIAINNEKFKWKGKYFVETPGSAAEKIFFEDNNVNEKNPSEIRIKWVRHNLTINENAPIRISLWGYRETTIRPEFLYIDQIADGITNTGEFTIVPAQFRNRDNQFLTNMKFGFLQINLTEAIPIEGQTTTSNLAITPVIWSRPIPLGWYFGPQWERRLGINWPKALCDEFLRQDRFLKNFAHELHQCPCTLEHALNDRGRFLPDVGCDRDSNPRCEFNTGAMHCVRTGSPTLEGSEQQCCYDKNNFLMLSYDNQWGSFPRRSHNLGFLPWNEANKVPTLSHWWHDIVPRFLCCKWQEEQAVGCETLRFERRPSQDCVSYQAPAVAGVFGDPHMLTFDNLAYTFNGKGEFVLVRTKTINNQLDVQGRFEQMPMNKYGEVRATELSAVAARGNSSTVVEVRRRPQEARWRYRLDVLVDGRRVYFDRPALRFQHFPGVTVYTPTYILNQSEVIMMFDSGAGVEVVENRGHLTARVFLPWNFINQTRGLFGNWSFDMVDDFTLPDDFGMRWMLEDREHPQIGGALFHREHGRTAATYNNVTFRPEFRTDINVLIPENRSAFRTIATQLCHENYQCLFDYALNLDRHQAHFTLNYYSTIINMKQTNERRTISCGILPTPRFGRKSNFLFVPGTTVMFECNTNFVLVGDQRRECLPQGQWNVPDYGYTECLRQQEYSSRYAGLTAAIVLCIILPIVLLLAYIAYKFIQKRKKDQEEEAEDDTEYESATLEKRRLAQEQEDERLRAEDIDDDDDEEEEDDSLRRNTSPVGPNSHITPNPNIAPTSRILTASPTSPTSSITQQRQPSKETEVY
ncbi:hypothetical protein Trydic_g7640 [Trypoxylus dichotomus]